MKFIKWKMLLITCGVCLLPILFGISIMDRLPEQMAIHFNLYNQPDNFASREFVVFGIPFLLVALQIICCLINDINAKKFGERKKLERATKWIIPVMSLILQTATFGFNLGWNMDIRRVAAVLVGGIFLVVGNFLPKLEGSGNGEEMEKALKINRGIGYSSVGMGVLFLLSVFLPPIATIACVVLLIPYAIFGIIYGIKIGRK